MPQPHVESAGEAAKGGFNAGETILGHVSDSSIEHPLIHLPKVFGVDMSVTKHVFMLWFAAAVVLVGVTWVVRRYLRQERPVPTGFMGVLEYAVLFVRDEIVEPNVGRKWVNTWTPLILTFFLYILAINLIGLVPLADALGLLNHTLLHPAEDSFLARVVHGGSTPTGNFNVTAALATISFFAVIVAGTMAHGFVQHWKNLVPGGVPKWIYPILIPIEIISLFVRPFALTMRLAANMTGGHIAILAILSFVFLFAEMANSAAVGMGIGVPSLVLASLISVLEVIVALVQAYVFTLLTAVFVGMAIHAHH
jgi:F-type H+-transporting ATPase subunit a